MLNMCYPRLRELIALLTCTLLEVPCWKCGKIFKVPSRYELPIRHRCKTHHTFFQSFSMRRACCCTPIRCSCICVASLDDQVLATLREWLSWLPAAQWSQDIHFA
jgi:hypothetical protein